MWTHAREGARKRIFCSSELDPNIAEVLRHFPLSITHTGLWLSTLSLRRACETTLGNFERCALSKSLSPFFLHATHTRPNEQDHRKMKAKQWRFRISQVLFTLPALASRSSLLEYGKDPVRKSLLAGERKEERDVHCRRCSFLVYCSDIPFLSPPLQPIPIPRFSYPLSHIFRLVLLFWGARTKIRLSTFRIPVGVLV